MSFVYKVISVKQNVISKDVLYRSHGTHKAKLIIDSQMIKRKELKHTTIKKKITNSQRKATKEERKKRNYKIGRKPLIVRH